MMEHTIEVIGLDSLTESMQKMVRKYPDRSGEVLREEALKTRKEIVNNARASMNTDNRRKKSLGRIGSYRVSQVQGIGINQYVEISARSPHFHLLERGHALVRPYGRRFKLKSGKTVKVTFKNGGKTIGSVPGKFFLKKAKESEALRFPEVVDKMVDTLLKDSGLW